LVMRKFLRDVKISTRVSVLVILILLLMSVVVEFSLRQIDAIGKEIKVIAEETVPLLESVNKIAMCHARQEAYFEEAMGFGKRMRRDEAAEEDFRAARQAFSSLGENIRREIEKGRGLIERTYEKYRTVKMGKAVQKVDYEWRGISKEYSDYGFLCERIFNLISQGKFGEAEVAMEQLEAEAGGVDKVLGALALKTTNFVADSFARAENRKLKTMVYMLSFSAIIVLFSLVVGILISHGISKLLGAAVKIADRITAGEGDVKIKVTTKDETGTLLAAMEKMNISVQEAEGELIRKRNLLRTLMDTLPDQIFAKDTEGVFVYNNLSCSCNLGADSPKEVVGKTDFDFFGRQRAEEYRVQEEEIIRTAQPLINHEVQVHNGTDGTTKWFSTTKVPWRGENGNIIGIVGLASDITERKRAEQALEAERNKAQKYLNVAEVIMLVIDSEQKVCLINRKGCEVLGRREEDIIGKDWCDNFVPERGREEVRSAISNMLKGNIEPSEYLENPVSTGSGEERIIAWHNSILSNEKGQIEALLSSGEDITERKQAEDNLRTTYKKLKKSNQELKETQSQLVQNEKLASIGQLAAGVAHEMNTPVGFVASNFQTLESYVAKFKGLIEMYGELLGQIETLGKAELKKKADDIKESWDDMKIDFILKDIQALFNESREGVERVTSIIQNLKDFSRVDQLEEFDEYDLNSGINATLVVARNEIKYDADLKTDLGDLPSVYCNPGQINQVFLNILVNAAQAIKLQERDDKGTIAIRTYATETEAVCEVSDDGPGISPDNLSKIFDPFFTTKPSGKGTGLGLSVSHDIIVTKHKGELLVDSTVGEGTTFTIKLPIKTSKQNTEKETVHSGKENSIIC